MPFVTGGLAVGSLNGHEGTTLAAGAVGAGTAIVVGWTVGAGLEVKVTPQWSVKGEYLYVDLGNNFVFNDTLPALGGIVVGENVRFKTNIVRAGLDYHFVWGGLPIAR